MPVKHLFDNGGREIDFQFSLLRGKGDVFCDDFFVEPTYVAGDLALQAGAAKEGKAGGFFDLNVEKLTGKSSGVAVEDDDFVLSRPAGEAGGVILRRSFAEDLLTGADDGGIAGDGETVDHGEQALVALFFDGIFELAVHFGSRRVATF